MDTVKIWEEVVNIPTYEVGKPDKNPMFLEKRVYQGSTGKIYPLPNITDISSTKTMHGWKAVFLENEYIKIMILPELGGRIQRAYDKTNDYDFVYYNKVIKPALVGLTGPWISGGIEFNWPQHHRPSTYSPVDYKIEENEDGSKTLITGDVDRMYGTKEITKFTLYPGKAYIEITGQLYNRTPLPQTFLWWANPAVSVNDYTQSIFPPDVHNVYDHGKRAVSRFPIATGEYYKHDYSEGVDISRYKNIPVPTSYMAEKSDYDFVGGYDYQKKAGLLHVADHHISPGKKQWTWGCGEFGKAWDRNLTDEDGPYIELMTGMFCDNQPDFTWLKPYEEKTFKQYFMPYKEVGQVKNATINAALKSELSEDGLHICIYATSRFENAQIVVTYEERKIYTESVDISPTEIYDGNIDISKLINCENAKTIDLSHEKFHDTEMACNSQIDRYKIKVTVYHQGKELVSYQEVDPGIPELAEPAKAAKAPEEIQTNEELFLTAQHIEQYRHATFLPDPYYLEGLKRDPKDSRINNAYGLLLLRRGQFERAEEYFRTAIERLTAFNPNPYDSEAIYNLGLSLFYQERYDEAFDAFYKATWSSEQQEMGFYFLAVISARRGDYESSLEFVEKSLVKNTHNVKGRGLKALLLIMLEVGQGEGFERAKRQIEENLSLDQFDNVSTFAQLLVTADITSNKTDGPLLERDLDVKMTNDSIGRFKQELRNNEETYLNLARDLAESGFYQSAIESLSFYDGMSPLVHYYKSVYYRRLEMPEEAKREVKMAEKCDPYLCFPNKLEDIYVLKEAIKENPKGARAYYYLGCLYYDKLQYEEAIGNWEKSMEMVDTFPTLLRNLSIAYYNKRGGSFKEKALALLTRAFELDRSDARVFLELDQLRQIMGTDFEDRLRTFEENIELIEKRDDLYTEYVTLLNNMGRYEKALEMIERHEFKTWEGAEGKITGQYKVALTCMARQIISEFESGETANLVKAREYLEKAISYPENLGEGRLEGTKDNNIYFYLGLVTEYLGDEEKSREYYEKAVLGASEVAGVMYYYDQPADMILFQGYAYYRMHRTQEAKAKCYKLLDYGEKHLRDKFKMDYFAVSMPDMTVFDVDMDKKNQTHCYYLMGLGYLGLGNTEEASENFMKALSFDMNHQNARIYLSLCSDIQKIMRTA
ncbi:DUF5107 domain-containing protein [Butyrivibrio proteoclasticus]|uniref:DUF5107 domain-containing protein n=1 Tax=Butyrivibrio proteoclasticus TaxID=43305 RepID=UPI00047AB22E|nr:DUF5107 domain-containing protein [Butyrivibrio proteoclasticus]